MQTIPSIGFNVETIEISRKAKANLICWDIGTGCRITYLWHMIHSMSETADALVWYVVSFICLLLSIRRWDAGSSIVATEAMSMKA